jgi:hypothetical protein
MVANDISISDLGFRILDWPDAIRREYHLSFPTTTTIAAEIAKKQMNENSDCEKSDRPDLSGQLLTIHYLRFTTLTKS